MNPLAQTLNIARLKAVFGTVIPNIAVVTVAWGQILDGLEDVFVSADNGPQAASGWIVTLRVEPKPTSFPSKWDTYKIIKQETPPGYLMDVHLSYFDGSKTMQTHLGTVNRDTFEDYIEYLADLTHAGVQEA
jgi:hypothetical protein